MPKAINIDPTEMRSRRVLDLKPIPLNQYDRSLGDELLAGNFTKADLIRIQRDMMIIRAFEEMLDSVKKQGHFKDIPYNHRGPAHLSIGQEAAAVGQAYLLDVDDHIYGSHRSHGEILAKSLSAIHKLDDNRLMSIMSNYFGGDCLRVVEKDAQGTTQDLAINFIVYGALAEIFARDTGVNRGFGGSMHAFFPPFGVYPNNAIVGGSADIAVGAALFKHVNQRRGIVIANIGDASAGCVSRRWTSSRSYGTPTIAAACRSS
jgi:2-oxoisovalerate dehydrogenase E1 component